MYEVRDNIWASQEQPREVMGFKSKVLAHFGAKSKKIQFLD